MELSVRDARSSAHKYRAYYHFHRGSGEPVYAFDNTLDNAIRGITERVFLVETPGGLKPPPAPTVDTDKTLEEFEWRFERMIQPTLPYTAEQFVGTYSGGKRKMYENALKSLDTIPLGRRDFFCKRFTKYEKRLKEKAVCRIISARSPRYNIKLGRYIKRIEKKVYKAIDEVFGYTAVVKGCDGKVAASIIHDAWHDFSDPVGVGLDMKRFDQHVSVPFLKWEHRQYPKFFSQCEKTELEFLLRKQLRNSGVCHTRDHSIKYTAVGTRSSGDMNTSCGNTLLVCAMLWTYLHNNNIRARVVNNGDDSILILERRDLTKLRNLPSEFLKWGFQVEVEDPVFTLEHIEFCQCHPVFTSRGWTMVRSHKAVLAKDAVCLHTYANEKLSSGWLAAVGDAGCALADGVPVQYAFYDSMRRGQRRDPRIQLDRYSGLGALAHGLKERASPITEDARVSYWLAFGITPEEQIQMELESKAYPALDPKMKLTRGAPPRALNLQTYYPTPDTWTTPHIQYKIT